MKLQIIKKVIVFFIMFNILFSCIPIFKNNSNAAESVAANTYTEDLTTLDETIYPGYKSLIDALKQTHSNYKFVLYYTGLNWEDVINAEYQSHGISPLNLFQVKDNYEGIWYCPICGKTRYDNGSLCCASKEAIAYMMDPRNSLNEDDLFQFKSLEGTDVSIEEIRNIVSSKGAFINNNEAIQAIYDASVTYNVNAYFLISKILNEHGNNGTTLTAGQGYNGNYVGYYNYFNVGSFGNGTATIINNGLKTAQSKGWNTIRASILGGAEILKNKYMDVRGQKTLYLQKFNVSYREALFSYQYQANILAAQSQGESLKKYYGDKINTTEMTFIIPVYENMPTAASERPSIYKTNTITYEMGVVTNISTSLKVRASASKNGLAIGKLNNGESIKILKKAESPVDGYYWDLIVSNVNGTFGYAARNVGGDLCITPLGTFETSSGEIATKVEPVVEEKEKEEIIEAVEIDDKIIISNSNLFVTPEITVTNVKEKYPNAVVKNSAGEEMTGDKIGTGYKIKIEEAEYVVVKKGDVNGDGGVNILDAIAILNHIKNEDITDEFKLEASRVLNTSKTTISDAIYLLNYIKGEVSIEVKSDN